MDRRMYGAFVAAPAVAAGLYALYQYKSKKKFYVGLNVPVFGFFSKVRNVIYRNTLQDRLWNYIESRSEEGNADSVLAAFDDYCYNYEWSWAIGDKKGSILAKVVQEAAPKTALELGTFLGYSAVVTAQNMPSEGKLITVEANPKSAEVAQKIINRSGFADKVTVVNGTSTDIIPQLHTKYNVETLDFVFFDHFSNCYTPDLQKLEKEGFLHKGSVVFADNINGKFPGSIEFSDYLNKAEHYECQFYESDVEYTTGMSDGMLRGIYRRPGMFSVSTEGEALNLQDQEQPK